jgi:hypothetical protein
MAGNTKKISSLIEQQLPGFISSEYENFSKLLEKYYEQLESTGQPIDIINNITKYSDINFYDENILKESTKLASFISDSASIITVENASSFPKSNGYIKINGEICFYKTRTDTEFLEVSRGVSGNTTIGDLYSASTFVSTKSTTHQINDIVYNVSNLFLYAFVKNFESQYLGAFPEKYLKGEVDKRTLIKNINKFYKTKGTDKSIKFIFNSIVSKDPTERISVYNPKDSTIKASTSDWVSTYSLKVKILSGNPFDLIGKELTQQLDETKPEVLYASAVVDNVVLKNNTEDGEIYEIILDPSTINGKFEIASKTTLQKNVLSSTGVGKKINVGSTLGWNAQGKISIGSEVIKYNRKNARQFTIEERGAIAFSHPAGSDVYSFSTVSGDNVSVLILGVLYNFKISNPAPYSEEKDFVQISGPGFETKDPIIFNRSTNQTRWIFNQNNNAPSIQTNLPLQNLISEELTDVSAIYEDSQYYYICSSGYPSHDILSAGINVNLVGQDLLRLIRKNPTTTTEVYSTGTRDVGIFVDGTLIFNNRDSEFIDFGKLTKITVTKGGTGYKSAPFVLLDGLPGKARAFLSGEVVDRIDFNTDEVFNSVPAVEIVSGRNAVVDAIVTDGRVTSLVIKNAGEYYSSPPFIRITDLAAKGKFAEYKAIVSFAGEIVDFEKIDEGKFYTQENIIVEVIENARNARATATAEIEKWYFNRFEKYKTNFDSNYGYVFETFETKNESLKEYIYGQVANPTSLRIKLNDNLLSTLQEPTIKTHSPILGFAYDGLPIYGPFGYENPTDSSSAIARLTSGYVVKQNRIGGPSIVQYPLGTFVEDYEWRPSVNTGSTELDVNNGRFCVTPDYPNGVYAYFMTANSDNIPVFPYILGKNYYSLPIDSNFNSNISQLEIPVTAKRLKTSDIEKNGDGVNAFINSVSKGGISEVDVQYSSDTFQVDSIVRINNNNTEGRNAFAAVSSVTGKNVVSLESKQTKATEIKTLETAYYFEGDTITQPSTGASGTLIGDVINRNQLVLRNVIGSFVESAQIQSTIQVVNLIIDQNSSYSEGSTIILFDGVSDPVATGLVLETSNNQNAVKVRVLSGTFVSSNQLFLKSSNLNDTVGSKIALINSLSFGLTPNSVKENIAIVETDEDHNLTIGDKVIIDVNPDDSITETTYFVRKRYYQRVVLREILANARIVDTGIGSFDLLNSGVDYREGVYGDVELIFQDSTLSREGLGRIGDPGNARATITVVGSPGTIRGGVVQISITSKGVGYKKGDVLTVRDTNLLRLFPSNSTQRLALVVDHVGFSTENTQLTLNSIVGISNNDLLKIGQEIVRVANINVAEKTLTVLRGQNNTRIVNHYNNASVVTEKSYYNFFAGQSVKGISVNDPIVISFNQDTQELLLGYDYLTTTPNQIVRSNTFFDSSVPQKLVTISSVENVQYNLEFSTNNTSFTINPIVQIQKYYKYKFDVSHVSMNGTFLDFSTSANYNIFTEEKEVSNISPGNPGSFVSIKLGFGPNIATNNFEQKQPINFTNYFYFIKVSDVNTQNSFLQIIDDPLTGEKIVTYSTNKRFAYELNEVPEYDGSGTIKYTTTAKFAIGEINSIGILNFGENYSRIPTVYGVDVSNQYEAAVNVTYDSVEKKIKSITVLDGGKNYHMPVAVVVDGDGDGAQFEVISELGVIKKVNVINEGKNYSYPPRVKIIESDVKIFFGSNDIGIPQTILIIDNGYGFHADKTLFYNFKSPTILLLSNLEDNIFFQGEKIIQRNNGEIVFSAVVANNGFRPGSNILKLEKLNGIIDKNLPILGTIKNSSANIKAILSSIFEPDIRSYYDNLGQFVSDRGKINVSSQKITDSFFYQDYSYVIKSKTSINVWRDLVKNTTHPAGFELFGDVLIETDGNISMPSDTKRNKNESVTFINLGAKNISVIDTKRYITQSFVNFNSVDVRRGIGSISVDTVDTSETVANDFILSAPFTGKLNPITGQPIGTTVFTLIDKKSGLPFNPYNEQQLIISLDGIYQEPKTAFTVNGTQITFASPPFGSANVEGQEITGQKFYGRYFRFKNNDLNQKYLRKLQPLDDQFDGEKVEFDLYYEDNSIVKTDVNENLIVALNGVIQKAKYFNILLDNYEPTKNSYYILRSSSASQTDKIVFSSPPIKHNDIAEISAKELEGNEKSFIYSVGSYLRYKINNTLIPFRQTGPFLILDESTNKVKKIENTKYALVFVNGVLQIENESYQIVGSTITFSKPLNYFISESGEITYSDVNIIFLYGRDIDQSLTAYNFERDTYYNKLTLTVTEVNQSRYNQFTNWYSRVTSSEIIVYQGNNIPLGKIKAIRKVSNTVWQLTLASQNVSYINNVPLRFTVVNKVFPYPDLILSGSYQVTTQYKNDDEGNRILVRSGAKIYYESEFSNQAWIKQSKLFANLHPGDLIKIDGENEYREIIDIPGIVKPTDFRLSSFVSNSIYGKLKATNYNDIVRGEGLSITANISNGKVVSLNWNKRDLQLYFDFNILLQSTAYQYFITPIINFISNDTTGGGATAEVVITNGQVLDIVITNPGQGYQESPTVAVSRGYDVLRKSDRKIDSFAKITLSSQLDVSSLITSSLVSARAERLKPEEQIITLGITVTNNFTRKITAIIQAIRNVGLDIEKQKKEIISFLNLDATDKFTSLTSSSSEFVYIIDIPADIVSSATIKSVDRQIDKKITKILNNAIPESAQNSTNDIGAFLDIGLNETDNIVYITDTRRFPYSGRLLIGKEIVTYNGKLPDRFLNVTRGAFGTTATTHNAGDYIRHLPELISIASAGPTSIIWSEVTITEIHNTNTSVSQIISTLSSEINEVSMSDDRSIDYTTEYQIDVDNADFDVIKEIIIKPATSYAQVLNDYILTSISFIRGGVDGDVTSFSSAINTIQSVNRVISREFNIDVHYGKTISVEKEIISDLVSIQEVSIVNKSISIITLIENSDEAVESIYNVRAALEYDTLPIISVVNIETGIVDYYIESVVLDDTINTRSGEIVVLNEPENQVILRDENSILVTNRNSTNENYFGTYTPANAGFTLRPFIENRFMNTGSFAVNGFIGSLTAAYPSLIIQDSEERLNSSYTLSGEFFKLTTPSINSAGSFITSDVNTTDTVISVQSTKGFLNEGYILLGKEVIKYNQKTSNSFIDLERGAKGTEIISHSTGDYLRSFD